MPRVHQLLTLLVLAVLLAAALACGPDTDCTRCLNTTANAPRTTSNALVPSGSIIASDVLCLDAVWSGANNVTLASGSFTASGVFMGNKYSLALVDAYALSGDIQLHVPQISGSSPEFDGVDSEMSGSSAELVFCYQYPDPMMSLSNTCRLRTSSLFTVSDAAVVTAFPLTQWRFEQITLRDAGTLMRVYDYPTGVLGHGFPIQLFQMNAGGSGLTIQHGATLHIDDAAVFSVCRYTVISAGTDGTMRFDAVTQDIQIGAQCDILSSDQQQLDAGLNLAGGVFEGHVAAGLTVTLTTTVRNVGGGVFRFHGPGNVAITTPIRRWVLTAVSASPVLVHVTDNAQVSAETFWDIGSSVIVQVDHGSMLQFSDDYLDCAAPGSVWTIDGVLRMWPATGFAQAATMYVSGAVEVNCASCSLPSQPGLTLVLQDGGRYRNRQMPPDATIHVEDGAWSDDASTGFAGALASSQVHLADLMLGVPGTWVLEWLAGVTINAPVAFYTDGNTASLVNASNSGALTWNQAPSFVFTEDATQTRRDDRTLGLLLASSTDILTFSVLGHNASLSCPPVFNASATGVSVFLPGYESCLPGGGVCQGPSVCTVYPYNDGCTLAPISGGVTCPPGQECIEAQGGCVPIQEPEPEPGTDPSKPGLLALLPLWLLVLMGASSAALLIAVLAVSARRRSSSEDVDLASKRGSSSDKQLPVRADIAIAVDSEPSIGALSQQSSYSVDVSDGAAARSESGVSRMTQASTMTQTTALTLDAPDKQAISDDLGGERRRKRSGSGGGQHQPGILETIPISDMVKSGEFVSPEEYKSVNSAVAPYLPDPGA